MKNYIGIDISKASLDVYDGKKSYKFKNNEEGFNSIVALMKNPKETVLIYAYAKFKYLILFHIVGSAYRPIIHN